MGRGDAEPKPWITDGKQRKKDGKLGWRIRFTQENYPPVSVTFYGTKAEAYKEMARLQTEQASVPPSGLPTNKNIGWLDYLEAWTKSYQFDKQGNKRPRTTVAEHERSVSLLTPYLKKKRLSKKAISKVTSQDINEAIHGFTMKDGSPGTPAARGSVNKTLRMAFNEAKQKGLILNSPVSAVSWSASPRDIDEPAPSLEEVEQIAAILTREEPSYIPPMPIVLFMTGLRVSEALGLRLSDVALDNQVLTIKQKRTVSGGRTVFGKNKTPRSSRTVPILHECLPHIVTLYQNALSHDSDYLFCGAGKRASRKNENDEWVTVERPESIGYGTLSKAFRRAVREAYDRSLVRDLYTLHSLRHGYATWLIGIGIDESRVSAWMGHESTRTTSTVYRHASSNAQIVAADEVSSAIQAHEETRRTKATETFLKVQSDPDHLKKTLERLSSKSRKPSGSDQ